MRAAARGIAGIAVIVATSACVGAIDAVPETEDDAATGGVGGNGGASPPVAGSGGRGAGATAGAGGMSPGQDPGLPETVPVVMRRLTRAEYDRTVRDLLGDTTKPAAGFPPEDLTHGFENNGKALTVPPSLAEAYFDAAESIAGRAITRLGSIVPCAATSPDASCAATLIRDLGLRAWRRPLTDAEAALLQERFMLGQTRGGFAGGADLVIRTLLFSPAFVFRVEIDPAHPTSWEMASRLSYFLWGTMPDSRLFETARRDALRTPEQIAAEADRMLKDGKAAETVRSFHRQWLELASLDGLDRDTELFPHYKPELAPLFQREIESFTSHAVLESGLGVDAFFGTSQSFVNAKLAAFYGVPAVAAPKTDKLERVMLDPSRRHGILTTAGLLASHALREQSSPTRRGKFLREQVFCLTLPPPPPGVDNTPLPPTPSTNTRDRFAEHAENPSCAGCHALMDPLGFALENYDAVGAWRDQDGGKPVDASAEIVDSDIAGRVDGSADLARKLNGSAQVRACLARQWFRFALGREASLGDRAELDRLAETLAPGAAGFRRMLLDLTQTRAFLGGAP